MRGFWMFPSTRPGWVLAITAALTLGSLWLLPQVVVDSSTDTIFLEGDPERLVYEDFKKQFGEDEVIVVALATKEGDVFNTQTLSKIDRITRAIEALPKASGVDRVVSLTHVDDVQGRDGNLLVEPFMKSVPTDAAALAGLRTRALANPLYARNLVSENGKAAAINVLLQYLPKDRFFKMKLVQDIRAIAAREQGPEQVYVAGIPVLTTFTGEYLRKDMKVFIPLTVLIIAVVLWLTFRSWAGVLLPLTTVGVATLWTVAFITLTGGSIAIITSIVPSLLIALGASYSIHMLSENAVHGHLSPKERTQAVLKQVLFPVFLCGLTTVIGFASLITNNVQQLREFGLYSSFGVTVACFLAMFSVPAALYYLKPGKPPPDDAENPEAGLNRVVRAMVEFDMRHPWSVLVVTTLAVALCVWSSLRIEVDTDYARNFKPDSEPVRALNFMREHLSGERPVSLVVKTQDGSDAALDPQFLATVETVEKELLKHPLIGTTLSVTGYLKNMNQAMFDGDPAQRVLPRSRSLATQYIDLYGRPEEISRYLSDDRSSAVAIGRSSIISSQEFVSFTQSLKERLQGKIPERMEVILTGSMYLLAKASLAIAWGQVTSLASAVALIFITIFLLFRSVKFGIIAILPNLLPVVLAFGVMGLCGVTLNTGTAIAAAMTLGIAVDDTIHLLIRYRALRRTLSAQEAVRITFHTIGRPVVFASATNAAGFMVLMLSSFAPLYALGWLTAATVAANLYGDLIVLPALLVLADRETATEEADLPVPAVRST